MILEKDSLDLIVGWDLQQKLTYVYWLACHCQLPSSRELLPVYFKLIDVVMKMLRKTKANIADDDSLDRQAIILWIFLKLVRLILEFI